MTTSTEKLFDPILVQDLINKVKGRSSLAVLSGQKPVAFNGQKEFTFTLDKDIDIVAENGKKSEGGLSLAPVTIVPIKVEYGARISDEFNYASKEEKLDILKAFNEGYAKKLARGLDLMVFHGINPRTKTASTIIGGNSLDEKVTQTVDFVKDDPDKNVEDAVALIQGNDGDISGMVIDSQFSSALAKMRDGSNNRLFPTLAWGANPGSINGLKTDVNNTVGSGSKDLAVLGDFANMFQWGFSKQIPMEIIPYGDPDNSGEDLKGHNQLYLRSETYLGWGIMDPNSFARVITPTVEG